jgi:hypothetical protein
VRCALVVALALFVVRASTAQVARRPGSVELRVDGILARRATTTHLGLGLTRAASRNLDLQLVLGGGVTLPDERDGATASGRADVLARFGPAPTNPNGWGVYVSGGVGALVERGARGRGVMVILVGARGRRAFFEAGLGGGLRVGAGLRF